MDLLFIIIRLRIFTVKTSTEKNRNYRKYVKIPLLNLIKVVLPMQSLILRTLVFAVLIGLFLVPSASGNQKAGRFNIPDRGDIPDLDDLGNIVDELTSIDTILANLPGFGLSMDQEDPITSSFDDCVYDCPFLDEYPRTTMDGMRQFIPTLALPQDSAGHTMVMPGRYETTISVLAVA